MNRSTLFSVLTVNLVALAVLYARYSDTVQGTQLNLNLQAWMSRLWPTKHPNCGLLKWDDFTLISQRVVLEDGVKPAALHIVHGKIKSISDDVHQSGPRTLNFKNSVIMPGVIDVHVHLNEPGRTDWEGMPTGTRAAALGGVTTVIDMPLNSFPVTTTLERLREKQALAREKSHVNMGFWAGLVPSNAADHVTLKSLADGGAVGFKIFMCPSGINDFDHVTGPDIAAALPFLKRAGVPLMVHAEVMEDVPDPQGDPAVFQTYMNTRPAKFEQAAIRLVIELLDNDTTPAAPGFSVHIAHLADSGSLPIIQAAQARHPITVETCAHFLNFHDGLIQDKQTWFKCSPPIRDAQNMEALSKAVVSGAISIVSSDHSPAPPGLKQIDTGDFLKAWGGISGLQYLLPATWTALQHHGGGVQRLVAVLCEAPARLVGMSHRKGRLAVGYDADIVVFEPESNAETNVERNQHQHKLSPYTDMPLLGKVTATVVNGHFLTLFGGIGPAVCGGPVTDLK